MKRETQEEMCAGMLRGGTRILSGRGGAARCAALHPNPSTVVLPLFQLGTRELSQFQDLVDYHLWVIHEITPLSAVLGMRCVFLPVFTPGGACQATWKKLQVFVDETVWGRRCVFLMEFTPGGAGDAGGPASERASGRRAGTPQFSSPNPDVGLSSDLGFGV